MSFKIATHIEVTGRIKEQGASGGSRYAVVVISLIPTTDKSEPLIETSECKMVGEPDNSSENYLAAVIDGIKEFMAHNALVETNVSVLEIRIHPVDSFPRLFKTTAYNAMQQAVERAGTVVV